MFEGFNWNWNAPYLAHKSSAGWRKAFDGYREMQRTTLVPRITVLFSSGTQSCTTPPCQFSTSHTAADIAGHRFSMGTALLDDGFYFYSLHGNLSAPLWFDEFSVDLASGNAVEDRTKKGYLGQPLTDLRAKSGNGPAFPVINCKPTVADRSWRSAEIAAWRGSRNSRSGWSEIILLPPPA
jgi:hypothetical protein